VRVGFIQGEKAVFPVRVLCRALGVTRSGSYAWQRRPASARVQQDRQLTRQLRLVHAESRQTYGRPRLHRALRARGIRIGEKRVQRLMRAAALAARGRRRFRVTTDSTPGLPVVSNQLARRFAVTTPNTVWAADITALWTRQGWCYLAVVLDLASRRVVGWAVRPTPRPSWSSPRSTWPSDAGAGAPACSTTPTAAGSMRATPINNCSPHTASRRV